jgi:hypothetical protein
MARQSESGAVFLDILAAILISVIGLGAGVAALSTASRHLARQAERTRAILEQRNAEEAAHADVFEAR